MRGIAGQFPLDYATVCVLGEALIELLRQEGLPARVIIGRDTRVSGKWLEQALFQGMKYKNGEVISAGIIPTSAVSFLTKKHRFSAGIVISASHNPYKDNGIKIFSSAGMKIPETWERQLEKKMESLQRPVAPETMQVYPEPTLGQEYTEFLLSRFPEDQNYRNMKVVLDCSNGASSAIAPFIFQWLGFNVVSIGSSPDGRNINRDCGSLHPESLIGNVIEANADIGIAYDGDADRAIWVDEKGRILDGDFTLFVQSRFMKEKGRLKSDKVVATTMSNMGLEKAVEKLGLKLIRTEVGDRFVLEEMLKSGANLGGEQSGHTIFLDDCPTGDGILTSIKMVEVISSARTSLSALVQDFRMYPQIHRNVQVTKREDFSAYPEIVHTMEEIDNILESRGRFNIRYSGTEPLVRIMMEGQDQKELENLAEKMAKVLSKHLG